MKRNIIFIAVAAITLLAASCSRKCEYVFETYATLYKTSYMVDENAGEVKLPVILRNSNGSEVQISVAATEGKAIEGTDFEIISPASGILTFTGESDTLEVVVKISDAFMGDFTGTKDFSLQIASITDGVTVGNVNKTSISINDLDHPLAPFVGVWSGTTSEQFSGASMSMSYEIATNPDDVTKLNLTTSDPILAGYGIPTLFTLEADAVINTDGTGQIVIGGGQPVGIDQDGPCVYLGLDTPTFTEASSFGEITFNLGVDGKISVPNGIGLFDVKYIYGTYVGGFTLTKE